MRTITTLSAVAILGFLMLGSCKRQDAPIPKIKPSDGNKLTLDGGPGGSYAENAVYVDLSTDKQFAIKRSSWNLGFHCGAAFSVILNSSMDMSAMVTNSTDIKSVNKTNFDVEQLKLDIKPEKLKIYDDTLGRLNQNVIAEIKANANDNKVYVINSPTPKGDDEFWKVRIVRSGTNAYTLEYAKLDDQQAKSLSITKDEAFNFKFISFASGPVNVEPKKEEWDFVWTRSIYFTSMAGTPVPYSFSDLIFTNHLYKVTSEQIIFLDKDGKSNGKPTYDEFDESKLSLVTFKPNRNVIGANWRSAFSPGAYKDRYYVIKDNLGNIYKLKFIAMGAGGDGGKRGYPELEYKLVKAY